MKIKFFLVNIFVIGIVMRIYNLGGFSFGGDEALNVIRASWFVRGFSSLDPRNFYGFFVHNHSPAEFVIIVPFIINGIRESVVRFPFVLIGSFIPIAFYFYYRKNLSSKLIVSTMVVLAVSPILVGWSRVAMLPIIQVFWSVLIIFSLARALTGRHDNSLTMVAIIYGLSFWILVDFILIAPLVVFVAILSCEKNFQRLVAPTVIFLTLAGLWFAPYSIVGFLIVPKTMGINYIFAKKVGVDLMVNLSYYYSTFFANIFVWPFIVGIILGLFEKRYRENILFRLSGAYIVLNLFFYLFVYGTRAGYLYVIYFPIVLAGTIGLRNFFSERTFNTVIAILVMIFVFQSLTMLWKGESPSESVWGLGKKDFVIEASEVIRKCTARSDLIISDLDGFKTSLYFNRKYPSVVDRTGVSDNLMMFPKQVAAVYLKDDKYDQLLMDDGIQRLVYPDGSVLYLDKCLSPDMSAKKDEFYQKFWGIDSSIDFFR